MEASSTGYFVNYINDNIIDNFEQKTEDSKSVKVFRRILCTMGICAGFAAQVPFVKIAMEASNDPVFSKVLGTVYFISFGTLFSWLYYTIVDEELGSSPFGSQAPFSHKKACLKTVKIGLAFILGFVSVVPDAWFGYQFNGSIAYPLLTFIGGVGLPVYSFIQSWNKIADYKFLSDSEKTFNNYKTSLVNKIDNVQRDLRIDLFDFEELKSLLLYKSNSINSLESDSLTAPESDPASVHELFEIITRLDLNIGKSLLRKSVGNTFWVLGVPLGIAQLALSFFGTKNLMEHITNNSASIYGFSVFCTAIVTYLYGLDIPSSTKAIIEKLYDIVIKGESKTLGAKISPKTNVFAMGLSAILSSLSWGSLYTLARTYFHDVKILGFSLEGAMKGILPAGFAILIYNALMEISDGALRKFYSRSSKNEVVEIYLRLEKLKNFVACCPESEIAKFVKGIPEDNDYEFNRQAPEIRVLASGLALSQSSEQLRLLI